MRTAIALLAVMAAPFTPGAAEPGQFRAGAALSNITPPLGTTINGNFGAQKASHIHDELHARCLVLDDGTTRLAFAICDNTALPREVTDAAKDIAAKATGIPAQQILIAATHSHSCGAAVSVFGSDADTEYVRFLPGRIADGIIRASNNLGPARVGWSATSVPGQVFNRRWKMKADLALPDPFGGADRVKMNPGVGNPNLVAPAGPTDPEVSVVAVQSMDGRPVALLANYSLHYVGGVGPGDISADYYGAFCDRVQELLGADRRDPPFVAMMSNGTSGDINNIDCRGAARKLRPYEKIREVARDVASAAVRAAQAIQYRDTAVLGALRKELVLGARKPAAAEIERARAILAKAEGRPLKGAEEVFARETVLMSDFPAQVPLIIQAFRIGDLAIAQIPCEVFVETGLAIKKRSPFKRTFTVELANGYNGYLPTPEQHALGGYETWRARSSYLEADAEPKITGAVTELLAALSR